MYINRDHLVDYTVFKKSLTEKHLAYAMKKQWQRTMRMFHGKAWRKYYNFPEVLKDK